METNNKLRKALEKVATYAEYVLGQDDLDRGDLLGFVEEMGQDARAALAEPVKNSDVGTAEEQLKRKRAYCKAQDCRTCQLYGNDSLLCAFRWAQLPYNEGGNDADE